MTSPQSVKLIHGAAVLDLTLAPFELAEGFTPPATLVQPIMAVGTSANRFGGSTLVGRTAGDRAFSFGVHLAGQSTQQLETAARRIQLMLDFAGDPDTPLYLVYRSATDTTMPPLWGQSALSYEINFGTVSLPGIYGISDMRARAVPNCTVDLTIKPYAQGTAQLLANATGGILPDQWGTSDSLERGVFIPPAVTNKMTNPVFGHATWNNGWTAGGSVLASQNTNPQYLLPQTQNSAFLQQKGGNTFTQSINVGNTNTHTLSVYVMRPDMGAVSSADLVPFYSINQTGTFRNLGDGLWLMTCSFAGINAGTATGVTLVSGRSVYILGVQLEQGHYTPLAWGDLLGCAWTGTAHASTSTRTVAVMKVATGANTLNILQGSVRVVWIAGIASSGYAAASTFMIFDTRSAGGLVGYLDTGNDKFTLSDGTNSAAVAAGTAAGDVVVLHFTWGPAGLAIYKNGSTIATNGTYTVPALGTSLFIGSDLSSTNQIEGEFADFTTWAVPLTAAEVLADYNNINDVSGVTCDVAQRVSAIPWLYTSAGDGVVGPGTGVVNSVQKYNWATAAGIPGSAVAITQLKITSSQALTTATNIFISRITTPFFYNTVAALFGDVGGTADVATSIGDAFSTGSVGTAVTTNSFSVNNIVNTLVQGREVYLFSRLKDAGANLTMGLYWLVSGGGGEIDSDFLAIAADATMRLFKTLPFIFPRLKNTFIGDGALTLTTIMGQTLKRTTGSGNASEDFFTFMFRPLTQIVLGANTAGTVLLVKGTNAKIVSGSAFTDISTGIVGDIFELDPNGHNIIQTLFGSIGSAYPVTTTLTFTSVWVTPRYSLI